VGSGESEVGRTWRWGLWQGVSFFMTSIEDDSVGSSIWPITYCANQTSMLTVFTQGQSKVVVYLSTRRSSIDDERKLIPFAMDDRLLSDGL
jgi:hypothetical protein